MRPSNYARSSICAESRIVLFAYSVNANNAFFYLFQFAEHSGTGIRISAARPAERPPQALRAKRRPVNAGLTPEQLQTHAKRRLDGLLNLVAFGASVGNHRP